MTTMYKNDTIEPAKDSPKESGLAIMFDYSFFQSLKNTATILAKDTAELMTKGILPELSTSDSKADTVEDKARHAADIIAADPGLAKQEDKDEIAKLLRDAKENGTERALLAAINKELQERGSNSRLNISIDHADNPHTGDTEFFEKLSMTVTVNGKREEIFVGLISTTHQKHESANKDNS